MEVDMKGTAKQIVICGRTVKLGDKLKVQLTARQFNDGTIEGTVTELWSAEADSHIPNNHLQGRLSNGWCFHDEDKILQGGEQNGK